MNQASKPLCKLIGEDGNIFNLLGIAARTLKESGMTEEASDMCGKVYESRSYNVALAVIGKYIDIV